MNFYEPLPLGSDAYMAPLAPAPEPRSSALRKVALWCVLGTLAGASAGGIVLAFMLDRDTGASAARAGDAEKAKAEPAAADEPAHEAPRVLAAMPEGEAAAHGEPGARTEPELAPTQAAAADEVAAADTAQGAAPADTDADAAPAAARTERAASHRTARPAESLPDKPSREQVLAAMARVQPAVKACLPGGHGMATAALTILGRSGRISNAQVSGQIGPVGSCIARAVRKAKFPKFATESISVRYPMSL